jgi:putative heme-binding domain-containing protein
MKTFNLIFATVCCVAICSTALANNNHHGHSASKSAAALPTWKLTDSHQRVLSNDQFAGRPYILVLHLGEGCLHCAKQLHAFGDRIDAFRDAGVEVVGVSTDDSEQLASQLSSFKDGFSLKHLVSDHELELFRGIGAFDNVKQKPLHGTVLVDAAGRVRWSNIGPHPFMEIDRLVAEARLVSVGATTTQEDENAERPKIFLDKSARIVAYQLKRLSNEKLLMVSRKTDDKKYIPVWSAILARSGMDTPYRKEALKALTSLNESSAATELIAALDVMKSDSRADKAGSRELANMLLKLDASELSAASDQLVTATKSKNAILRQAGFAGLVVAGQTEKAIETSARDDASAINWLRSVGMIRNKDVRNGLRDQVLATFTATKENTVRTAAIDSMKHFTAKRLETYSLLASKIGDRKLRAAAVKTMLAIPAKERDPSLSAKVIEELLEQAEATPAAKRTQKNSLLAMQLADELIAAMPEEEAESFRKRMGEVSVRVVRVKTIKEEMRYDVPYFAAEAGRPIQIVLDNEDLMPHNLIVCKPGKLKQVAIDGLEAGPRNGLDGKQYVPKTKDVLFATDMVGANEEERLTFKVPKKPGNYPFVCTFPQHWSRMYGVMVVVDDLAAWEKNPIKPEDPIGNQRQLVKKWTLDDFDAELEQDLSERSLDTGKRIFTEATCAQCHQLGDYGGAGANVGPALDELYRRWDRDRGKAMKQIFDPSSHVDPKYQMFIIATDDGLTRSGLIVRQNDEMVELLESGSVSETTKILKEEIDEMAPSKKSVMPKALLDNFTKEEILDLINYLETNQK